MNRKKKQLKVSPGLGEKGVKLLTTWDFERSNFIYRRAVVSKFGGPDVLKIIEEDSLPEPGPGQVRIMVSVKATPAASTLIRKGKYPDVKESPPFTPGYDMVGVVDKLGSEVTSLSVGQIVADMTVIGAHSEYICLAAGRLVKVPDNLDPAETVALVLTYVTAYQMLHRIAEVESGDKILIHGAAGGVGTAMIHLGKLLGLEIFGTDSAEKLDIIESLGATPIDYQEQDFVAFIENETSDGVDAAFDPIGGSHLKRSFASLRRGGHLVDYGFYNAIIGKGGSIPLDFLRLTLWNLLPNHRSAEFYSIGSLRKKHPDWFKQDLGFLFNLLLEGKISPVIWKRYALDQLAEAHRAIDQAEPRGKVIITFNGCWLFC